MIGHVRFYRNTADCNDVVIIFDLGKATKTRETPKGPHIRRDYVECVVVGRPNLISSS